MRLSATATCSVRVAAHAPVDYEPATARSAQAASTPAEQEILACTRHKAPRVRVGGVLAGGLILCGVPHFRIAQAAELLGVSDDTVRRWLEAEKLPVERDRSRRRVIDGASLAAFARDQARPAPDPLSL